MSPPPTLVDRERGGPVNQAHLSTAGGGRGPPFPERWKEEVETSRFPSFPPAAAPGWSAGM